MMIKTNIPHIIYIPLNPNISDNGPIITPPKAIPKSAHAIYNPNNMFLPTFDSTKLK